MTTYLTADAQARLSLSPRRADQIRASLKAWLGWDPDHLWADHFNCPAIEVLGELPQDADRLADFIHSHYRTAPFSADLKAEQVRYVVLHWLADLACGLGRY